MMLTGCPPDVVKTDDTGSTDECPSLTVPPNGPAEEIGGECVLTFSLEQYPDGNTQDPCFPDTIQGFVIEGVSPAPSSASVTETDSCGEGDITFSNPGPELEGVDGLCGDGEQVTGNPSCNTYPEGTVGNVYTLTMPIPPGGDCDDIDWEEITFTPIDAEDTCGEDVESLATGTGCTPGTSRPMDFVYWKVFDLNDDGTYHALLQPVQMSGAQYSERAWLRKVVVTDWGDATEFYVRGFGEPWAVSDDDVIDGSYSLALTSGNTPKTFSVGQVTMGTTWSIDGVVPVDGVFELPTVELDWSCEVDSGDPHFVDAGASQGYAKSLSSLGITGLTYSQRLILRFPNSTTGTLELEGRSSDRLQFDLTYVSAGVYSFEITNEARGGSVLSGTVTASGTNRVVAFDELVVQGTDLGTPSWTFAEVP